MPHTSLRTHAFRLHPGDDLKISLQQFCVEKQIKAACILSCVGSLQQANLRFADKKEGQLIQQKLEIVSLVGTLSIHGLHLHIALADGDGKMIGGHLLDGNFIYTTAEIVIGELEGVEFLREQDTSTGYKELVIQ
ncbi:MAG: PPC domain-containing DNA-binding protein [Chitinophagales bacterium]